MKVFKESYVFWVTVIILSVPTFWLLSPHLNSDSITGWGGDPYFCTFVMDKVSNQFALGLNPFQDKFWDIPFFYPAKRALAYSDPFILQGFLIYILEKFFQTNLFLSVNIVFILFFILSTIFAALFYFEVTKNRIGSVLAGWLWAFSLHHLSQSAHFQNTAGFGIPMALFFLFRVFSNPSWIYKVGLALSFFLLVCSNLYYFVFAEIAVGYAILYRIIIARSNSEKKKIIFQAGFALILAIAVSFPVLYRYLETRKMYPEFENARGIEEQVVFSARAGDYVSSLHDPVDYQRILPVVINLERIASPGLYTFAIVLCFILFHGYSRVFQKILPTRIFYFGLGLFILSALISSGLLIHKGFFSGLFELIPGIKNLRAIGRIGILVVLAECLFIALLFKYILHNIRTGENKRYRFLLGLFLFLIVALQVRERLSFRFREDKIKIDSEKVNASPIVQFLAIQKIGHVEFPVMEIDTKSDPDNHNNQYLLRSLFHHQPILNGYSGYTPSTHYNLNANAIQYFLKCSLPVDEYNSPLFQAKGLILNKDFRDIGHDELDCLKKQGFIKIVKQDGTVMFHK